MLSLVDVRKNLRELNYYPFKYSKGSQPPETPRSVKGTIQSVLQLKKAYSFQHENNSLLIFRKKLNQFVEVNNKQKTPVFINKKTWEEIEGSIPPFVDFDERWSLPNNWMTALAFASFISNPILNGIPEQFPVYYGYYYYKGIGKRLEGKNQIECKGYAQFINVTSISNPEFEVVKCR